MRRSLFPVALAAILAGALLVALGAVRFHSDAEEAPMTAADPMPSTDAAALAKLITLPGSPQAVRFDVTDGADRVLCALIDDTPGAVGALLAAAPVTHPDGGLLNVTAPDWMVAALSGAITVQADGLQAVALPLHDPSPFARAPFLNGWAFAAGPGRIALCLFSM